MARHFLKHAVSIGACAACLSSCIVHRATVKPVHDEGQQLVVSAMGNQIQAEAAPYHQESALPEEIPATLWLRDRDGNLLRGDVTVQTARPWWQRFPADIMTDLLPFTFSVEEEQSLSAKPLEPMSREALDEAAQAFGFEQP